MRQHLVELHIPGQRGSTFFIVEMPTYGEPDCLPQNRAFQAFLVRELKRAFPDESSGKLINGQDWMEYARRVKYCSEHRMGSRQIIKDSLDLFDVDINTVPVCNGIWDLYQQIGYDKNKKRYL